MMLRVSAMTTETEVDLQGVNGDAASAALGIEYGAELMSFAESLAQRDEHGLARSRTALRQAAGNKVLVDAAGVAANFQRMARISFHEVFAVFLVRQNGLETYELNPLAWIEYERRSAFRSPLLQALEYCNAGS